MYYGVSWYPEQKGPEEIKHDLKLLAESGVNTVRLGEFAWCRMEPREGEFQFDWLEEAVALLAQHGIKSILCTPTACPPAWMVQKHPDLLYVDNRGVTRPFGGRRHYCYNNEAYRRYCGIIAEKLGERFGKNPEVIGYQIDNEFAQEGTGRCHCPACEEKFRLWLGKKYGTPREFNRRSGSVFWSQEITTFSQITLPVNTIEVGAQQQINAFYENPTIRLDFERFCSDSMIEFQEIQVQALRAHTQAFITTNSTGLATNSLDNYQSTAPLDRYAFDYYPGLRDARVPSFPYAFARGIKDGTPFWVLEFMSGGGHRLSGSGRLQPNPGALEQAVVQSLAHGAEMMLHFQFRSFPCGAEQLNYAIVDMDGVPRRRYYEMQHTAQMLKKLEPYEGAAFRQEAAICLNYDSHWALRIKPANDPEFQYLSYCEAWYTALEAAGVNADVISPDMEFDRYKLLILPASFVLDEKYRKKLIQFTENGGILVATFLTGVKNSDNIGYTESLPAGLTDLFGISVQELEPVFPQNHTLLQLDLNGKALSSRDSLWSELLEGPAQLPGHYTETYKAGSGVISCQSCGKGTAWYVGTGLEPEAMNSLVASLCDAAGLRRCPIRRPACVEAVSRDYHGASLYYLFNFSGEPQEISFDGDLLDVLTDSRCSGHCEVAPHGYAVLKG